MLTHRPVSARRAGAASTEAALVLSVIVVPLMIGVWEIGRLVYAQQVVANAAREGCRLAAQGRTINGQSTTIEILEGSKATPLPSTPNVWDTVYQAIVTGGLKGVPRADIDINFDFIDGTATRQPYEGLKGERFRVTVNVPFAKVRWINLGLVNPTDVYFQADWRMLVDDPFVVNPSMPTPPNNW